MAFQVGDRVTIRKSRRAGTITEMRADGRLRVSLGSLSILCSTRDLEAAPPPPDHAVSKPQGFVSHVPEKNSQRRFERPLDLHGLRVREAIDTLAHHLDQAIRSGIERFEVIHGIGQGAVMDAVHDYLRTCPSIQNFRPSASNPGSTWVYL